MLITSTVNRLVPACSLAGRHRPHFAFYIESFSLSALKPSSSAFGCSSSLRLPSVAPCVIYSARLSARFAAVVAAALTHAPLLYASPIPLGVGSSTLVRLAAFAWFLWRYHQFQLRGTPSSHSLAKELRHAWRYSCRDNFASWDMQIAQAIPRQSAAPICSWTSGNCRVSEIQIEEYFRIDFDFLLISSGV